MHRAMISTLVDVRKYLKYPPEGSSLRIYNEKRKQCVVDVRCPPTLCSGVVKHARRSVNGKEDGLY